MRVVLGARCARTLRRAGIPVSPVRSLSPSWYEQVMTAKFDCLPPVALAKDHTVVSVGAHFGNWPDAVLQLLQPKRLIAFEPTPETFSALSRRFSGRSEVDVRRDAVGDRNGSTNLHTFTRPEFNSLLPMLDGVPDLYGGFSQLGPVDVPLTTLDDALSNEPQISILHIDAQGSEPSVIRGAPEILARTAVIITVLDFVAHYDGEALFAERSTQMAECGFALHSFGYQCHDRDGRLLWAVASYRHL